VREHLRRTVGRLRLEERVLVLRRSRRTEHLRRGRLIEATVQAGLPDRLQQPNRSQTRGIGRVFGLVEAHPDVRLRGEVIHLVRAYLGQQDAHPGTIDHVPVVHEQADGRFVGVDVQVVDPTGVERGCAPDDPVHLVTLEEQQFGQIRAVLARDASDQCALSHRVPFGVHRRGR
jgi:hypothetical protein